MSVARVIPSSWRNHVADYWLLLAAVLALLVSGALMLGLVPVSL